MYESKYGTNKPSWVSVSQVYVLYPCNYDNKMIFDFDFDFDFDAHGYSLEQGQSQCKWIRSEEYG